MTQEKKTTLTTLMKKQVTVKSVKKNSIFDLKASDANQKDKKKEEKKTDEEIAQEEALEEAKKESSSKAANYNQSEMLKKLLIENIVRYSVLIGTLVILAIAVINSGPAIMEFFHGLISNIIFSAIKK